jgi:RNA polymerase sigma factor (sigma-70 family)
LNFSRGSILSILIVLTRADRPVRGCGGASGRGPGATGRRHRFEPWLHRILTRECYALAKARRRWSADVRLLPRPESGPPRDLLTVEDRDQLDRAFRRLPAEHRAVLVYHHYLGLPLTEVAERVGAPLGTVKSRLHYAVAMMRASVEADARSTTSEERPA